MSWVATDRFGARTAPGGLALVQEMVNTHAVARGGVDLLADPASGASWAQGACQQWAHIRGQTPPDFTATAFDDAEVQSLIELRDAVTSLLTGGADPSGVTPSGGSFAFRAQAQLCSDESGRVRIAPSGTASRWLASALWSEVLLAQHDGTWSRMKLCHEPGCRTAFFDASRNSSGTWHNVHTCGNIANLRASRNRRKVSSAE